MNTETLYCTVVTTRPISGVRRHEVQDVYSTWDEANGQRGACEILTVDAEYLEGAGQFVRRHVERNGVRSGDILPVVS